MINQNGVKLDKTQEFKVQSGQIVNQEGLGLVQAFENGEEVCRPAIGQADEIFIGTSYGEVFSPLVKSSVETYVVPAVAPLTVNLTRTPLSGQILLIADGTPVPAGNIVSGVPGNDTQWQLVDNVITAHANNAGETLEVTFRYSPTAEDLMYLDGNTYLSTTSYTASDQISSIGAITGGEFYTDMFDAGVVWAPGDTVYLGPGGVFTNAGAYTAVPNCVVYHIPTVDMPFLGIRY